MVFNMVMRTLFSRLTVWTFFKVNIQFYQISHNLFNVLVNLKYSQNRFKHVAFYCKHKRKEAMGVLECPSERFEDCSTNWPTF